MESADTLPGLKTISENKKQVITRNFASNRTIFKTSPADSG